MGNILAQSRGWGEGRVFFPDPFNDSVEPPVGFRLAKGLRIAPSSGDIGA